MSADAPGLGPIGRARQCVDAIRVVRQLHNEGRTTPTAEERERLTGWAGWGPLAPMFAPKDQTWLDIATEVASLLSEDDLSMGHRATYSAFYTPPTITRLMWEAVEGLGFIAGQVLEAGCGGGRFFATALDGASMVGVERDPTSAEITRLLYPNATVITSAFEQARLGGGYAAAVGNVPFGNVGVHDPTAPTVVTESIHNYFIWRILHELAPGGVAVLLTSRWTMDASNDHARRAIAGLADFIGAVRLPNGGLGGGTDIASDILVLRRKGAQPATPSPEDAWISTRAFAPGVRINGYWDTRPEMVLGTMKEGRTNQYGLSLVVEADDRPLPGALQETLGLLVERAAHRGLRWEPALDPSVLDIGADLVTEEGWHEGSIRELGDGTVIRVVDGKPKTIDRPGRELRALMELRGLAVELVAAEADWDTPDADIQPLRERTLAAYERYVNDPRFGAINRSTIVEDTPSKNVALPKGKRVRETTLGVDLGVDDDLYEVFAEIGNRALDPLPTEDFGIDEPEISYKLITPSLGGFRSDPDFQLVAALEDYDDDTRQHRPAPILSERQNRRVVRPTHTSDPKQALAWSLDRQAGQVDLEFIATVLGVGTDEVPGLLGDAVYLDPQTRRWLTAEDYLSGNVRIKLTAAQLAAAADEQFTRNVASLEAVQPKWLEPHEITANLGAPWIDKDYVEEFIRFLLRYPATVKRLKDSNQWEVIGGARASAAAVAEWGTQDMDAYALIQYRLNNKTPIVKVRVTNAAGDEVMRKDSEKSMVAAQKQQEIAAEFERWIWSNPERAETLSHLYNHRFNATVARTFDGSHITIDGLAPWFKPWKHQPEYVARAIGTRAALAGHPVGAGKTAEMAMVGIKLKQLGLINKAMVAVPKHLLEQTTRQMRQLFPAARILSASSESIAKNRRAFAARCATGDWDLVIITHPAFDRLRVSEYTESKYLKEQQIALEASIREACPDGVLEGRMVKSAAKQLDALETRIRELRHRKVERDLGVTFEQLGIDYICYDEAHYCKNLAVPCRTDGFSVKPSKRASDLDMKLTYLRQRSNQPYASLFTGTPISNTMLELYVVLHYLMPEYLESIGLGSADAWASSFVQFVTSVDVTVDGGGFQLKTRPALFVNAPELRMLLSLCADIRTAEDLGLKRPKVQERPVVVQPTAAQQRYSAELVWRAEQVRGSGRNVGKGEDNMLKICTDGRRMATDPALVNIYDPDPGKLDAAADVMVEILQKHPEALIIGFCDVGTPNDKKGDQTYGRLKQKLVARGIAANKVAFIHSAKSGNDKAALFAECRRDGGLSIILGSTDKLGVGTNIQDRVKACVDIDAPYRPADLEQRLGRGARPGNRYDEILSVRLITARTFDAYLWQMLARKATFIGQMMRGNLDRTIEDITGETVLSFEQLKALATDQPLLMEKAKIEVDVKRLLSERRSHRMSTDQMRQRVGELPHRIAGEERELVTWSAIAEDYTGEFTEDDVKWLEEEAASFGWGANRRRLGGLIVTIERWNTSIDKERSPMLVVHNAGARVERKMRKFHKGPALVKELELVGREAKKKPQEIREELVRLRRNLEEDKAAAARPFGKEAELVAAKARLDQIQAELREAAIKASPDEPVADKKSVRTPEPEEATPAAAEPVPVAPQQTEVDFDIDAFVESVLSDLDLELEQLLCDVFDM